MTDDDEPKSGVSIEGGALVIEGEAATFLLTATPPPAAPLTVEVTVTEGRDFVADGELDNQDGDDPDERVGDLHSRNRVRVLDDAHDERNQTIQTMEMALSGTPVSPLASRPMRCGSAR